MKPKTLIRVFGFPGIVIKDVPERQACLVEWQQPNGQKFRAEVKYFDIEERKG